MSCELKLATLECNKTGIGYTAAPVSSDSNRVRLIKGHTKQFPTITDGQYFYIKILGCGDCCETAKVIGVEQDTLVLDRTVGSKCDCIQSNSLVKYDWENIHVLLDVAKSVGINVLSPLKYDTCTRTLSVDCKELFAADCGGCGCDDVAVSEPQSGNTGGLRGEKGDKGERGVGIQSLSISASGKLLYTMTDGSSGTAGTLPMAKGVKGERGDAGPKGDTGPKGEDGSTFKSGTLQGTNLVFTMSDNSTVSIDATGLKGEQGAQGTQGVQGPKGDAGYSYQYVEVGATAHIFGVPSTSVTITADAMPGVTFGPYTTGSDGIVSFSKPPLSGNTLVKIFSGGKLVGIGSAG